MPRHPRPARTCPAARLGQCLKSRRYRSPDKELTCGLRPTPAHLLAPGCGVRRGSGTSPRARRKSGWSHVPDTAPQHSYEQSSCLNSLFPGTGLTPSRCNIYQVEISRTISVTTKRCGKGAGPSLAVAMLIAPRVLPRGRGRLWAAERPWPWVASTTVLGTCARTSCPATSRPAR